jgi:hypothetical protein
MPIRILIKHTNIFLHNRAFAHIRMAEQIIKYTEALLLNTLRDLASANAGAASPLAARHHFVRMPFVNQP